MAPPKMAGWNLAVRFGIELAAFAGLAAGAWTLTSGAWRWVAAIGLAATALVAWGTFNVVDDPSRSGKAPVEVSGWTRLTIEAVILAGGVIGIAIAWRTDIAIAVAAVIALHYAASWNRVAWLIRQ